MIEQMIAMGYGTNLIKKALVAVKNESVPAALDMIDQIMNMGRAAKFFVESAFLAVHQ